MLEEWLRAVGECWRGRAHRPSASVGLEKNIGPVGPCLCDVPQPEGALRRLTMASTPGLVAVLRIVPLGDNVALGEMVQRVLSASLTPARSSMEEMI